MIEKLIVGRRIVATADMNRGALNQPDAASRLPAEFRIAANPNFWIQESSGSFLSSNRVSAFAAGSAPPARGGVGSAKPHRNFRWLPYVPGLVTVIPFAGADILTGDMTGCYIADFTCGGTRYIAHIGTLNHARTRSSVTAKTTWNAAIDSGAIQVSSAVNVTDQANFNPSLVPGCKWWAAVDTTGTGNIYNLELWQTGMMRDYKIMQLANMSTFGQAQLRFPDAETNPAFITEDI